MSEEIMLYAISDEALIIACINNDRRMWKVLYDRYSPKMYAVCLRFCKNKEDAQDNLQDGFIKAFKNLKTFRGKGAFEGWLRKIMVFTCISNYRTRHMQIDDQSEKLLTLVSDTNINALDRLNTKDILNIIQKLAYGYQMVFSLYVFEQYSHKQISGLLNITPGASRSQLTRAKQWIKKYMEDNNFHD